VAKEPKGLTAENQKTIADILASVTPVERTVKVCIDGTLGDRVEALKAEFEAAVTYDAEHNEPDTGPAVLAELDLVEAQVAQATVPFVCRALPSRGEGSWSKLVEAHPPGPDDEGFVWCPETFIPAAIAATVVSPAMTPPDAERLMESLSNGQVGKLIQTVIGVNVGDDLVPKSGIASGIRQTYEQSSATASLSESPIPST